MSENAQSENRWLDVSLVVMAMILPTATAWVYWYRLGNRIPVSGLGYDPADSRVRG